ncbi:uncharacterized protein LOC115762449 [Drosophila novamexicana]|uniref:uncharacterized protein LOC115762449 n=1 Tax=Drosophila novamexicana TaxID=47314 RepID=UPI0011E5D21C|nr:uncharacterized protein LOC115762449 [Drosophila novamexicana]
MAGIYPREAVRVKVKKCEAARPPEWRKFSVDPQITTMEVLYSLLAKAFDIKSDFSIKYKAFDPAGNEIYLAVLSDWDLDAAFLRIHNISIQTASEPCLMLQIDVKPFTLVRECETDSTATSRSGSISSTATFSASVSPLQSLGVSQKYVQHMQTKLPGLIMNQMEKTFSIVQKAFNLSDEHMANLPPRPPMCDGEFRLFLDALGQIQRRDELRKVIFLGGIEPSLRRVVWKHLLNVYPSGLHGLALDGHQRMEFMRRKSEQYYKLRDTWKAAVQRGCAAGELAYVTSMVKKDVLRTDRLHPFYAGSDDNQNIASLFNILTTYALNHPVVSYCQGMSDIASPLLVTMNDEAQAYICFCAIMARVRGNFMLDGIAMTQKFAHLTEALSFYDPEFWEYLKSQQADDLLFCYRWLLLELKREFPFEDALRMLEVQWSSLCYDNNSSKELSLYEKEFVPITEASAPNSASTFSTSYSATPTSPSYLLTKPRENPYTKVCALRRQSSSASLSSLSSSLGAASNHALDNSKRLNQSLDENISRHAARRQRRASAKAHQSLDESKMLALIEGGIAEHNAKSVLELSASEDTDDDVFDRKEQISASPPQFHETNPFKEDAQQQPSNNNNNNNVATPARVFLSSTSSSNLGEEKEREQLQGLAKLPAKNILNVSNSIAKQLASNASSVSESVKRVSSSSGGHFKDLKEKIAASSRMASISFDGGDDAEHKTPPKLVKNFNEFLNFAAINKNRISDRLANQLQISEKPQKEQQQQTPPQVSKPVVQLTKGGPLGSSLDESDSSSIPETSWSASTAATAIQQAQELSSYSLQMDLNAVSPVQSQPQQHQQQPEETTPDQDPDQEYYPMTNAITRELRLEAENLDRQVFGLPFTEKQIPADIEYEKLDKDTLDLVEDLKENEIITCPDVSELHMRRRQRLAAAKSNSVQPTETHTLNPFIDESQLLDGGGGVGGAMRNSSSLPEVIMPISTEPNRVEAPTLVEIATNADDESAYTRSPHRTSSSPINGINSTAAALPPPAEFGGGNAFLMFLCLTLLLQHRNTIIKSAMDYNEIAMHFDKMVRKHDVTRVLNQARRMYFEYLQAQRKQPAALVPGAKAETQKSTETTNLD